MGFTTEALLNNSGLLPSDHDRAWEVWDEPPATLPNTVSAFQLVFPTSELAVSPKQRVPQNWKDVIYIEAAPKGKVTVVTLFVTVGLPALTHATEPSFCLAALDIGGYRRAQLVAHGELERNLPQLIEDSVAKARATAESAGVKIPSEAYGYFFGHKEDGTRFIFGARMKRPNSAQ